MSDGDSRSPRVPERLVRIAQETRQASTSRLLPLRQRSLSFSAPVSRESYSSLPPSPAASYLSQFAVRDDAFETVEISEGAVLKNFLLGRLLGTGGSSECREAYLLGGSGSTQLSTRIALKIVQDPRCLKRFKHEISIWEELCHPNILPLFDHFIGPGYHVAVTVLADQGTVQELIAREGALQETHAMQIFHQVCQAVNYLHNIARVAHLDIKPENILLCNDGSVHLCDFGMCRTAEESCNTQPDLECCDNDFCCGSYASLPPEAFDEDLISYDDMDAFDLLKRQDIWAIGVVLYVMLSGDVPFHDDFIPRLQQTIATAQYEELPQSISEPARTLVRRMLKARPDQRPDIAAVMSDHWLAHAAEKDLIKPV